MGLDDFQNMEDFSEPTTEPPAVLKRKLEEDGPPEGETETVPVAKKRSQAEEDESSEYESTDSSWEMSDEEEAEEATEPARLIRTRSHGPAEIVQADAAMDKADEEVDNESDFSTSTEEEESDDQDAADEEEDEVGVFSKFVTILHRLTGLHTERYRRRRVQRRRLVCHLV